MSTVIFSGFGQRIERERRGLWYESRRPNGETGECVCPGGKLIKVDRLDERGSWTRGNNSHALYDEQVMDASGKMIDVLHRDFVAI